MKVEIRTPGRTVVVGPEEPSAADVLEYAEALIEEEGWMQISDATPSSGPDTGWTLHDAIGEANTRLFQGHRGGMGKDGITTRTGETTRQLAMKRVTDALPKKAGGDDKKFNDQAKTKDEVLAVLRKAREAVTA